MAGIAIGGWFVSPVINKVIDMAKSHLADNLELDSGMNRRLELLQSTLPHIENITDEAEASLIKDSALAAWLRHLKATVYKAEDLLDNLESKFHHDENKVRASGSSRLQTLKRGISSRLQTLKRIFFTVDVLIKLKEIVDCLEEIYRRPLRPHNVNIRPPSNRSILTHQEIIGRNTETDYIVSMLLSYKGEEGAGGTPSFVVLPIVGFGGVGKTMLARHIFEDKRLFPDDKSQEDHFALSAWLEVSDNFDIKKIANNLVTILSKTKNMVSEIVDDHRYDHASLEYMSKKLVNMTRNQRFLIVLDDVWNVDVNHWRGLHAVLSHGARGSAVLVTTQYQRVAKVMSTVDPVELNVLKEVYHQQLLEQCAFGGLDEHKSQHLQSIARQISKILQGLPRAANALGNLLRSNLDPDYWNRVLHSEWWEHNAVLEDVLPSLGFNYQKLNGSQRRCFAYCSIFPRDYRFEEAPLIHIWMAQCFIQPNTGGRMRIEDIGREVFAELVNRKFFQKISENKYVMPDIIRELAVYLSLDECFVINDETSEIIRPTVRHIAVVTNKLDAFNDLSWAENLRTILFFGNYKAEEFYKALKSIFKYSKSLRVLDLAYSNTEISKLPKDICNLSHLRYLDISKTKICCLPKLFCNLRHLQVLNLQCCCFSHLPKGMNKLINLRHLYAESKTIFLIPGIGKLTCLQELKEFHVRKKKGYKIEELKNLNKLRGRLLIQNLKNVDSKNEAVNAKLIEKKKLDALHLYFEIDDKLVTGSGFISTRMREGSSTSENIPNLKELLEGLEPCRNIKELGIKDCDCDMFPSWLDDKERFTSLESIHLSSCDRLTRLPSLGQLPSLRVLHIVALPALRKIDNKLYGNVPVVFPSLEDLKLQDLEEFEEWLEVKGRQLFPRLKNLHINQCSKLTKLALLTLNSPVKKLHLSNCPKLKFQEGLPSFTNLERLEIKGCPKLCETLQLVQPREVQGLPFLSYLHMDDSLLVNIPWILLGSLPTLQILEIFSCSCHCLSEEQETWIRQLTSLQELQFSNCDNLERLPNNLITLSSLKKLIICNCPKVMSLPKNVLPSSLKELHFSGCPLLKERCQKERGFDWPNISHLPCIRVDQETIQILE